MRTRRSNRTKRYTFEEPESESSSASNSEPETKPPKPSVKRRKKDDDDNFSGPASASASASSPLAEDVADSSSDSIASANSEAGPPRHRQRNRPSKASRARARGYLSVEPVTFDSQLARPYCGPGDRYARAQKLVRAWYGPEKRRMGTVQKMLDRWMGWPVVPPKRGDEVFGLPDQGVWDLELRERERKFAGEWVGRVREVVLGAFERRVLSDEEKGQYELHRRKLPVLMGRHDAQEEVKLQPGDGYTISTAGVPYESDQREDKVPKGWLFDTGGIVVGMDWAPRTKTEAVQLLALAVIPHADQEMYDYELEASKPDFQRHGTVQLWEFRGGESVDGYFRPSTERPRLRKTLCLDQGRAKRVRWSPCCGHLAILCGDGMVYVVHTGEDGDGDYEQIETPIASLGMPEEYSIKATAMTWANFNRLVVGYTDGSIALWSIYPQRLLSRHPIHHSNVVEIASGYPTMPYIIASTPVGGKTKIVDLRAPSYETTEVSTLAVATQPNLLSYSDHLLGFVGLYPSSRPFNSAVGFMHHSQFPLVRRLFVGDSLPTCLAVGRTHPFMLVGSTAGSLWALNPVVDLFAKRAKASHRVRVLQHEHRPAELFPQGAPTSERGASRLLQGFTMEVNRQPGGVVKLPTKPAGKKSKSSRRDKADGEGADEAEGDRERDEDDEGIAGNADPSRAVIHEPLTRITTVEWNPNDGYGCWAAAAMASGLVRVIDLGQETVSDE